MIDQGVSRKFPTRPEPPPPENEAAALVAIEDSGGKQDVRKFDTERYTPILLLDKWRLLQAICSAPNLSPTAKVVASVLLDCLNCKTGKCCPRLDYLAARIGKKRRVISAAIAQLINYGWLSRQRRRGSSNYRFAFERLQQDVQKNAPHKGDDVQEAAHLGVQDSAHDDAQETAHLNTGNRESGNGSQERIAATASGTGLSAKRHSRQPRRRKTCLPEDWQPSEHALSFARQGGLGEQEIPREVMKFKNYYIGKGILMLDWDRAWQNWCIRAVEYAHAKRIPNAGRRSLVAGLWGRP